MKNGQLTLKQFLKIPLWIARKVFKGILKTSRTMTGAVLKEIA